MPEREVSAWASYEQTARVARRFSNVLDRPNLRNRKQGQLDKSEQSRVSSTWHGARIIIPERVDDHQERNASSRRASSGLFGALAIEHGGTMKQLEILELKAKRNMLSAEILSKIRKIFPLFFENELSQSGNETQSKTKELSCASMAKSLNGTMPWVQSRVTSKAFLFLDMSLRGAGQVFFQNSPVTGLCVLVAMFIQSTRVATHGVMALVFGNLIAFLLGFDIELARSGLFGYNSFLVGLALATFDDPGKHHGYTFSTIIATIVTASFTSVLFVTLGKLLVPYKSPPLTLPFNIATILLLLASANMSRVDIDPVNTPELPDYDSAVWTRTTARDFFLGTIRGIGQVYLADNIISGILILVGIALCSRISALAAYLGSALGTATALATGVPSSQVALGMYGFNSSLSVTAMLMFYTPSVGAGILGVLSGIMTVLGQQGIATMLQPLGLPFMTLPFCMIALPFIIIQGTTSLVIAVPLASMTIPEDHLRRVNMVADGMTFLKETLAPVERASTGRVSTLRSRKMTRALSSLSDIFTEPKRVPETTPPNSKRESWFCCFSYGRKAEREKHAIKTAAMEIFIALDHDQSGHLQFQQVTDALQAAGLDDEDGIHLASLVLNLMDFDKSRTIDSHELVSFVVVCTAIQGIEQKLTKFFDFVDIDCNGKVDFFEIDSALEYLGQPLLSQNEKFLLAELVPNYHGKGSSENEQDEFDIAELMDSLTVAKVKMFADQHRQCRRASHREDESINEC